MAALTRIFFSYGEDQDLAWRIREKGFSIGYIEESEVFHWGGQSEAETPPAAVFAKKIRAEYLFYAKHYRPQTIARIKAFAEAKSDLPFNHLKKLSAPFVRNQASHHNKTQCYRVLLDMAGT